jgi:hypothetical protein
MTNATREFFARPAVRELLLQLRAEFPGVQAAMTRDGRALFSLPTLGRYCVSEYIIIVRSYLSGENTICHGRAEQWVDAVRESRVLVDDQEFEEVEEPDPPPVARPKCACGQELNELMIVLCLDLCADCRAERQKSIVRADLDRRIAVAKDQVDPVAAWKAWSTPGAES